MAYNLHFPNSWKEVTFNTNSTLFVNSCFDYKQRVNSLNPTLTIQSDILFPNALASVNTLSSFHNPLAVGCRGNQIDNEFPLDARVPSCLPVIQYPSSTCGISLEEIDMCARPVLNWENHIKEMRRVLRIPLGYTSPALNARLRCYKTVQSKPPKVKEDTSDDDIPLKERILMAAAKKVNEEGEKRRSKKAKRKKEATENKQTRSRSRTPEESNATDEEDEANDSEKETHSSEESEKEEIIEQPRKSRYLQGKRRLKGKAGEGNSARLKRYLFEEKDDLEEREGVRSRRKRPPGRPKLTIRKMPEIKKIRVLPRDKLPLFCIRKYKAVPELKIQGTWNHLYAGMSGACSTMENVHDNSSLNVFVGCGTQLRMASLKPSNDDSMLSYTVDSVWEEEKHNVPTNIRPGQNEPLSDLIYQIVPDHRNGIIAVRRGKSVEIYDVSECPHLLYATPNICYGRKDYRGWKENRFVKDPLLLCLDLNPHYAGEMMTIDENMIVNISSFPEETAISTFKAPREHLDTKIPHRDYPTFNLNQTAAGLTYTSAHSALLWMDSSVYLSDRRRSSWFQMNSCRPKLFDLRRSLSSMAWTDQIYYAFVQKRALAEYISCVKASGNPLYYYVGTTSRIFMMDWRVPDTPVMKMNHGMRTAATYIDTYHDGNYEVVVAGAQRTHETFCLITDHAHISCFDRPECKARNPIMMSYPRHLSNHRDFHKEAQIQHKVPSWPRDAIRAKNHNYAWTTGLSICKSPRGNDPERPPGITMFTGNHYGDIFYQEWEQTPIESGRKTVRGDSKLTNFFTQWHDFMETKRENYKEIIPEMRNTKLPVDASLLVKSAAEAIPRMFKIRSTKFDIFQPDSVQDFLVKKNMQPFSGQLARMNKLVRREYFNVRGKRLISVWNEDWQDEDIGVVLVKPTEESVSNRKSSNYVGFTTDLPNLPSPLGDENYQILQESVNENEALEENPVILPEHIEILNTMKREIEEDEVDKGNDSDVILCEDDDVASNEVNIDEDEVEEDTTQDLINKKFSNMDMSENAQQFSTQDLNEMGFPGLSDFYPVMSNPSHILPDDGIDDYESQAAFPFQNQYGSVDQDDNMHFGLSQGVGTTQELFSSQPTSQQFLFHSFDADSQDNAKDIGIGVSPFPYNPFDTGPGPSRASGSHPSSQSNPAKSQKRPGF